MFKPIKNLKKVKIIARKKMNDLRGESSLYILTRIH